MGTITPSSFSSRSSAMGTLGFYVGFKGDLGFDTPSLCSSRSSIDGDCTLPTIRFDWFAMGTLEFIFLVTPSC